MKTILKSNIALLALAAALMFSSCSDWTETKSIGFIEPDIEKDNPELYQTYLANLRKYRGTEHKIVYGLFNNTDKSVATSRGEHITAIPDSVDYVCMMNPDAFTPWMKEEMHKVQRDKGMKFVFNISYLELEREYDAYVEKKEAEEAESIDDFATYADAYIRQNLALVNKHGYDGISVTFYGMKTTHLTDAEKAAYLAREAAFMPKIAEWVDANPRKTFIFEGYPQNLSDKSILSNTDFIVIRTDGIKYAGGLNAQVVRCMQTGVPTDRFVVAINTTSLDSTDEKTGYFPNEDNKMVPAIPLAAEWAVTNDANFTKYGLCILEMSNDYYSAGSSYKHIREAIRTMNYSPKY